MTISTNNPTRAGDVVIDQVNIITTSGLLQTITPQVIGIRFYEDIFGNFISGSVTVLDAVDIFNVVKFIGEEKVSIRVTTPGVPDSVTREGVFAIYKIDDKTKVKERASVYTLHFISVEALISANKTISKCFSGKISDIAEALISTPVGLGSILKANVEETRNNIKFISNFWTPINVLQYLVDHSVNINGSPSYVFFENMNGLNFISIDSLYMTTPKQRFIWDNYIADKQPLGSTQSHVVKDYQRILTIESQESTDYFTKIRQGFYGSELITYDLMTRQYTHTAYKPDFTANNHLNDYAPWIDSNAALSSAKLIYKPKYYYNYEGYSDVTDSDIIRQRMATLSHATNNRLTISVFGRIDYTAGQKVYVDIPKSAANMTGDVQDKLSSGYYLIAAICHSITQQGHECVMELIKDSYIVDLNVTEQ